MQYDVHVNLMLWEDELHTAHGMYNDFYWIYIV